MNDFIYAFETEQLSSVARVLPALKTAGFDGLELPLSPEILDLQAPGAVDDLIAGLGGETIAAPVVAILGPSPLDALHTEELARLIHTTDRLKSFTQCHILVLRTEPFAPIDREEGMKTLTGNLITAWNHCEPAGITVALEFREGGVLGHYADMMDWLYYHSPETGLAVDAGAILLAGADPYRSVTQLGRRVRMVYLSAPATGDPAALHFLFSGLKAAAYKGPFALRGLSPEDPQIGKTLSTLRQLWTDTTGEATAVIEV